MGSERKKNLILTTSVLALLAAIVSIISACTEQWVVAEGQYIHDDYQKEENPYIQYGLFKGTYLVTKGSIFTVEVSMTCLLEKNICALLCNGYNENLENMLKDIYNGNTNNVVSENCMKVDKSFRAFNPDPRRNTGDGRYINAGARLVTIIALNFSVILGIVAAGVAVWNTRTTKSSLTYINATGLYIYNSLALLFTLIYIITWGIMFAVTLIFNVCVQETLIGAVVTEGRASLGYSYWINLIPLIFYILNITILYYRQVLLEKQNVNAKVCLENADDPLVQIYK